MIKKTIAAAVFLILAFCSLYGEDSELMDRAVKWYLRGDFEEAITNFERVLDRGYDERADRLLYNSLIEKGREKYDAGEYEKAEEYFKKASRREAADEKAQEYLNRLEEERGAPDTESPSPPVRQDTEISSLREAVNSQRNSIRNLSGQIQNLIGGRDSLEETIEKSQEDIARANEKIASVEEQSARNVRFMSIASIVFGLSFILLGVFGIIMLKKIYSSSYGGVYQIQELQERISNRLDESEEESEQLEERVARSINKMIEGQKNVVKEISMSASGKAQQDIEEIKDSLKMHFQQQQERLLGLLQQQAKALSSEETEKVELKGPGGRKVITDVNPHVRARADGVEMIPKTVTDPDVAQKMLKPYLSDPNNRVRANACVAIHNYNPELAVSTLKNMAESSDKWMRISAAWAVGELATPEMVPVLRNLIDDVDEAVRERAMDSFENLAEIKEDVGSEIRRMIKEQKKKKD